MISNCVENDNIANSNFTLIENKVDELITAINAQGGAVAGLGALQFIADSTIFTGVECQEDPHEEIGEVCVEQLVSLAQRDDYLNCLIKAQDDEIEVLSNRLEVIQSSCCDGAEDTIDPIPLPPV